MTEERIMTPEELKARLKADGVATGTWQEVEEHYAEPIGVEKQRKLLAKLRDLFVDIVDQDQQKIASLKEQIARLEHGGGV